MSDIAIKVNHLGKRYRIGQREPYNSFRDAIISATKAPFHLFKSANNGSEGLEYFYALKDVSFEVPQGEVVGIIGRNGSGKSTLLKILSRITTPTEGSVELHGRVGSLLEVGTGFHPELTGRENIFLSGTILGMRRREIEDKFYDIVKFSEIERFIDTPVKRYSSGMYVRLAFAVAAHLNSEILFVDEVLAVGDMQFQKKCLGKMEDASRIGRTVLFVSHNMNAIQSLCRKCILLENGKIKKIGSTRDVLDEYVHDSLEISNMPLINRREQENSDLLFYKIKLLNNNNKEMNCLLSGDDVSIVAEYICKNNIDLRNVEITYDITKNGEPIIMLDTLYYNNFDYVPSRGLITCNIPKLPLMPGNYSINIRAYSNGIMRTEIKDATIFNVEGGPFFKSGFMPKDFEARFLVDHNWELVRV